MGPDVKILSEIITVQMPYGRYKGCELHKLPISYLEWFARKGFPTGRLGIQLQTVYEIKLNGLEYLLKPLIKK